jgi:hypothetical protein
MLVQPTDTLSAARDGKFYHRNKCIVHPTIDIDIAMIMIDQAIIMTD